MVGAVAQARGQLTPADLEAGFAQIEQLAGFLGAFAERETNAYAKERWQRLSVNYQGTAQTLRGLLAEEALVIDDLPPGRVSALLDDKRVVIDDDLDGRWPMGDDAADDGQVALRDDLLPTLIEGMARRYLSQDWPWLADHLRAVGGLAALAQTSLARPLLARYFQAKDAYLWLALQRIAQGDPARRQALARRQAALFEAVRALRVEMAATFGRATVERLQQDWSAYVAQVDGFSATRGWLLLDPALRMTQLGAEAEADVVDLAAAEVMAEAPRSALAAARSGAGGPAAVPKPAAVAAPPRVSLGEIMAQAAPPDAQQGPDPQDVIAAREADLSAARAELATLQARVGELDQALATRGAEAARLEAALAEERARLAAAERRAAEEAATAEALSAEVRQLDELRAQMADLETRLTAQTAEAQRLEEAVAVERARLATAERERQAAAEALAREQAAREAAAVEALAREEAAREAAERESAARAAAERAAAEQEAAARAAAEREAAARAEAAREAEAAEDLATMLSRIEQRQLYMMAAIAVIVLLGLLLWLRARRRVVVVEEPRAPLLLTSDMPAAQASAPQAPPSRTPVRETSAEAAQRPIIEVPETPEVEEPPEASEIPVEPGRLRPAAMAAGENKVSGVAPETVEAKAAMKAGSARAEAEHAAAWAAVRAAELGLESEAAAHPIVRALRKNNLPLFELLFSELTGLRSPQLQRIVYGGHGEDLAIVCRAVGVDKLLFGAIYLLTDQFRGGDSDDVPLRTEEILRMYDRMPPGTAKKVLAKWQRNWGEELAMPEEETSLG